MFPNWSVLTYCVGNRFENSKEAYFQFRPKVPTIHLHSTRYLTNVAQAFEFHFPPEGEPLELQGGLSPVAENLIKRTNTFVSIVSRAVSAANSGASGEPPHIRARHEAEDADKIYRVAVRKLDRQRLGLEEKIEETLKALQRWELDRLRAVKTGLFFCLLIPVYS